MRPKLTEETNVRKKSGKGKSDQNILYEKSCKKKKVQLGVVKEGAWEGTGRRNCGWNVNK